MRTVAMALGEGEGEGGGIGGGCVEEHRGAGRQPSAQRTEEGFGRVRRVREERADLVALAAGAPHAIAEEMVAVPQAEREGLGLRDPALQEGVTLGRKESAVIGGQRREGPGG